MPATVKLERDGDVFTVSVAKKGASFQPVGAVSLALPDPVHVGLAVCSHDANVNETAIFSNVVLTNRVARPNEKRLRETSLETVAIETGERKLVFREHGSFECELVARRKTVLHQPARGDVHDSCRRRPAQAPGHRRRQGLQQ